MAFKDYKQVCEKLENGEFLSKAYVQVDFLSEIKASISIVMKTKLFIDFYDLELPKCISEDDLEGLLTEGITSTSHFLFTTKAVDSAVELLKPLIAAVAEETKEPAKGKKKESVSIQSVRSEIKKKLLQQAPPSMIEGFSDVVYSKLISKISETRQNRAKPVEEGFDHIVQNFNFLYICNKSLLTIQKKYPTIKPFQSHLCKNSCSSLLSDMLKIELKHHGIQVTDIKANDRPKLISKLPDYLKEIFTKLSEKISNKDSEGFIAELLGSIKDIPVISVKAVDKKTERMILHKLKSEYKAKVRKMLDDQSFVEAGIWGLRLRLIETGVLLDVPNEKWGVSAALEIYPQLMGQDTAVEFLRLATEDADKNLLTEMIPELSSLLSLVS